MCWSNFVYLSIVFRHVSVYLCINPSAHLPACLSVCLPVANSYERNHCPHELHKRASMKRCLYSTYISTKTILRQGAIYNDTSFTEQHDTRFSRPSSSAVFRDKLLSYMYSLWKAAVDQQDRTLHRYPGYAQCGNGMTLSSGRRDNLLCW